MGGRALKTVKTRRYERVEFFDVWRRFSTAFSVRFPDVRFALVRACNDKTSFGDMDVVIAGDCMPDNWHAEIDVLFDVRESSFTMNRASKAGGDEIRYTPDMLLDRPYSFNIDEMQVDLCPFETVYFDFALAYLSFGDLSNLMGTVYRALGARFGMKGLRVEPRDAAGQPMPNHQVLLTLDIPEALRFAGYDPARYAAGFESEEDVFRYVASSPYFRPALFLEERPDNAKKRERMRSRPALVRFIKWCETHRDAYQDGVNLSPEDARSRLLTYFPEAAAACADEVRRLELAVSSKRRFNGELIKEVTGESGQSIGRVAAFLRSEFEHTAAFHEWLGHQNDDELRTWIRARYETFRSSSESSTT